MNTTIITPGSFIAIPTSPCDHENDCEYGFKAECKLRPGLLEYQFWMFMDHLWVISDFRGLVCGGIGSADLTAFHSTIYSRYEPPTEDQRIAIGLWLQRRVARGVDLVSFSISPNYCYIHNDNPPPFL